MFDSCSLERVFYTFQGNTQWLMNGGFLDQSRPCDDLLVTPADVVPRFWEKISGGLFGSVLLTLKMGGVLMGETETFLVKIG